jgi:hypothetical protein
MEGGTKTHGRKRRKNRQPRERKTIGCSDFKSEQRDAKSRSADFSPRRASTDTTTAWWCVLMNVFVCARTGESRALAYGQSRENEARAAALGSKWFREQQRAANDWEGKARGMPTKWSSERGGFSPWPWSGIYREDNNNLLDFGGNRRL